MSTTCTCPEWFKPRIPNYGHGEDCAKSREKRYEPPAIVFECGGLTKEAVAWAQEALDFLQEALIPRPSLFADLLGFSVDRARKESD